MRVVKEVILWVLALFLAYLFVRAGMQKFSSSSGWAQAFHIWGYPPWFRILIGVVEVAAALLVLYKRFAAVGAILIIFVMLGAMSTHVFVQHRPAQVTSEIFPLVLAALVLAGRLKLILPTIARLHNDSRAAVGAR